MSKNSRFVRRDPFEGKKIAFASTELVFGETREDICWNCLVPKRTVTPNPAFARTHACGALPLSP